MPELAKQVMDYLDGDQLRQEIKKIVDQIDTTIENKAQITKYSDAVIADLYKTAVEHATFVEHESLSENELDEMQEQFKQQLGYWWIELQSEWIRYNNLMNYKIAIKNEVDPILQAKGSICSVFLGPIAGFLNRDYLDNNMDYLKGLIERCQYEGTFPEPPSGKS